MKLEGKLEHVQDHRHGAVEPAQSDLSTDLPHITGTLIVERPKGGWQDLLRSYTIRVDGSKIGSLRRGQSVTLELPAGSHVVDARIDWSGSPELTVEIEPNDTSTVRVEPSGNALRAPARAGGRDTWLQISQAHSSSRHPGVTS